MVQTTVERHTTTVPEPGARTTLPSPFTSAKGEAAYLGAYDASMRLWSMPYEAIDLPGRYGRTHLVACGPEDAPPLVLLHGFFTSLTNWAYTVADLGRAHRVYAPDMMGQPGKSIPGRPIRDRAAMADWLTGVLDGLGLPRAHLGGYSYGGFAALNYAIHAPERVDKLVLLTPVGGFVPLRPQFFLRSLPTTYLPTTWLKRRAMLSFMRWTFYPPNLRDGRTRRMFDCMLEQMTMGAAHFRSGTVVLPAPFADDELRRVTSPALLLIGRRENYYHPTAAAARANRLVPGIMTELIPHASHDLPVSQADAVNRRVLAFLQACRPAQTTTA